MEGPYISPEDGPRGAHAREHVRGADVDDFKRRQDAAEGRIRLVTLAPEAPGALPLVEAPGRGRRARGDRPHGREPRPDPGRGRGRRHALDPPRQRLRGHAAAPPEPDLGAARRGPPARELHRRRPPPAGGDRPLDGPREDARPDDPGHRRDGRRRHAARRLHASAARRSSSTPTGRVAAPGAPNLAGSALALPVAIGNTVRFTGLPLEDVIPMATSRPAEYIGIRPAGTVAAEWDADAASSACVAWRRSSGVVVSSPAGRAAASGRRRP